MATWRVLQILVLIVSASVPRALPGAQLKVHFDAIKRVLMEQVFTDNGRSYLTGDPGSHCNYAFLEHPRVMADGKRLRVTAHFSGRMAVEISGSCVGPGEAFNVSISGVPAYKEGVFYLDEVQIEPSEGFYANLIRAALGDALLQSLKYPVLEEVRELARQASTQGHYEIHIPSLKVDSIRIEPKAIVFSFDFNVEVR